MPLEGTTTDQRAEARQIAYKAPQNGLQDIYLNRLAARNGRKWEYIKTDSKKVGVTIAVGTVSGGLIGAGACGIVGAGVGVGVGCCVGGPPGMLIGGIAGGAIGAAGGGVVGALIGGTISTAIVCRYYEQWKQSEEGCELANDMMAFLADEPECRELLCKLTNDLPTQPVRTPQGQIYDRAAIEQWINENGTDPHDPRIKLKKEDLIKAQDVIYQMNTELSKLLAMDIPNLNGRNGFNRRFIKGMKALQKDLQEKTNNDFIADAQALQNRLVLEEISQDDFIIELNRLNQRFYPN